MFCPICGNEAKPGHRFCYKCGNFLPEEIELQPLEQEAAAESLPTDPVELPLPQPEPAVESVPEAPMRYVKKGRLWPAVAVLAAMIALGLAAFFLFPYPDTTQPVYSTTPWFVMEEGVLYFDESLYKGNGELTVPETVDGETVTAIGEYAFAESNVITTVVLPDTITEIGECAFSDCDSLRGIYIPENVRFLGKGAFLGCDKLEALYISGAMEEIGQDALSHCPELSYILYDGSYKQWKNLYTDPFAGPVELHTQEGTYHIGP